MDSSDPGHHDCFKEDWLEQLFAGANLDAQLIETSRDLGASFLVDTGEGRYLISLKDQHWHLLGSPRMDDSWDVAFKRPPPRGRSSCVECLPQGINPSWHCAPVIPLSV